MTDIEIVNGILLREDVSYSDRPADRGGPTKYGITLDTLARWRNRPTIADDVKGLTIDEAREIYIANYIRPWEWISDDRVRVLLIDWGVNSKRSTVNLGLQAAVGAKQDGVIGSETQRLTLLLTARDPMALYRRLWRARLDHYLHLALDEPRMKVIRSVGPPLQIENLRGWLHRLAEFACPA